MPVRVLQVLALPPAFIVPLWQSRAIGAALTPQLIGATTTATATGNAVGAMSKLIGTTSAAGLSTATATVDDRIDVEVEVIRKAPRAIVEVENLMNRDLTLTQRLDGNISASAVFLPEKGTAWLPTQLSTYNRSPQGIYWSFASTPTADCSQQAQGLDSSTRSGQLVVTVAPQMTLVNTAESEASHTATYTGSATGGGNSAHKGPLPPFQSIASSRAASAPAQVAGGRPPQALLRLRGSGGGSVKELSQDRGVHSVSCGQFHALEVSLEETGTDEGTGDDQCEKYLEIAVVSVPAYDTAGQWVQRPLSEGNCSAIFDGTVRWRVRLDNSTRGSHYSITSKRQHDLSVNFVRPGMHLLATATRLVTKSPQNKDEPIGKNGVEGKWWVQSQPQCFIAKN